MSSFPVTPLRVSALFPAMAGFGGIEVSGREAYRALTGSGWSVRALSYCAGDATGTPEGVQVVRNKAAAAFSALTGDWQADHILMWHLGLLKLLPLLRPRGARVILYLHGVEGWRPSGAAERSLLSKVDLFLSNSQYTWERFLRHHPELAGYQHRTLPLGLGEPVTEIPRPAEPPSVLTLGRAVRGEAYSKGHREMILAWPEVLRLAPDAQLHIAGPGDLNDDLRILADQLGISHAVRIWGPVSEAQKSELLAACRVFALPSMGEGFGLVYLEAMRLGRPCIVSNSDAGREVLGQSECGVAVDPADSPALGAALARLLLDRDRWTQNATVSQKRYNEHFTGDAFRERLRQAVEG